MQRALAALIASLALTCAAAGAELSDEEIRQILIEQSRAQYAGSCACPYHFDRAGHLCGRRSAYTKPGGSAPLCFASDVTAEMVEKYRRRST